MKYINLKLWIITIIIDIALVWGIIYARDKIFADIAMTLFGIVINLATVIQQGKYAAKEAEKEKRIQHYHKTEELLNDIHRNLDITIDLQRFIDDLDPTRDVRLINSDIANLRKGIKNIISKFDIHKVNIYSHEELISYETCLRTIATAFDSVLDSFSGIVTQIQNSQTIVEDCKQTVNMVGKDVDKIKFTLLDTKKNNYIRERKKYFTEQLNSQRPTIKALMGHLDSKATILLQAEYQKIDNIK